MNEIPKVLFSDSLASADWGETTIVAGDLAEAITRLKQERSDGCHLQALGLDKRLRITSGRSHLC